MKCCLTWNEGAASGLFHHAAEGPEEVRGLFPAEAQGDAGMERDRHSGRNHRPARSADLFDSLGDQGGRKGKIVIAVFQI